MKTVKIQGENFPIKFGLSAIQKVVKLVGGKSLGDLTKLDDLPVGKIPAFIMAGLESGAKIAEEQPPTIEQVEAELETNFPLFTECLEIFGNDVSPQTEVSDTGN